MKRLRASFALLLPGFLMGCHGPSAAGVAARSAATPHLANSPGGHLESVSSTDLAYLRGPAGRANPGEIVATFAEVDGIAKAARRLLPSGFTAKEGYLRNPNVFVVVIEANAEGLRWNATRQVEAERIIRSAGGTVQPMGRIAARVGPDGKTPIVMLPPNMPVEPIEARHVGRITFRLAFPTRSAAHRAEHYLDRGYQITVSPANHGAELTAVCEAETHNAMDVMEDFTPLAKRFGGKFDSMEGPG